VSGSNGRVGLLAPPPTRLISFGPTGADSSPDSPDLFWTGTISPEI
jgi:hypothetical protein